MKATSTQNFAVTATLALMVGLGVPLGANADEAAAKSLLKAMSDYLAAQESISFGFDTNLESDHRQKEAPEGPGLEIPLHEEDRG